MSPQQLQNELGLAARRGNAKLSEAEYADAAALVAQGKSPVDAVATIKAQQAPVAAPPKFTMNAAESKAYARLLSAGKSHPEAVNAIVQQRALAQSLRTPSGEEVRNAVAERNATDRWGPNRPGR